MEGGNGLSGETLGGDLDDLDLRVAGEQAQHLTARVPGASHHRRADHPAPRASSSTETARSSSAIETCSRGV